MAFAPSDEERAWIRERLAQAAITEDDRCIADYHRVWDTRSMVRIGKIHTDSFAAKTDLAMLWSPDLDLLPPEVVGCAFLVNDRRHCHDAFLLLQRILAARVAIVSREQFDPCQTVFD